LRGSHGFLRCAPERLAYRQLRGLMLKTMSSITALAIHHHLAGDRCTFWQLIHHAVGVECHQAIVDEKALDSCLNPATDDSSGELDVAVNATVLKGTLEANSGEQFAVVATNSVGAAFASADGGMLPEDSAGRHTACWAVQKAAHILTLVVKIAASYR